MNAEGTLPVKNVTESNYHYTVGDLCELFQITRKTLFYYDRSGLLRPTERVGVQNFKVYDTEAVERLRTILDYRRAGLTIQEIRILLSEECSNPAVILNQALDRLKQKQKQCVVQIGRLKELIRELE